MSKGKKRTKSVSVLLPAITLARPMSVTLAVMHASSRRTFAAFTSKMMICTGAGALAPLSIAIMRHLA